MKRNEIVFAIIFALSTITFNAYTIQLPDIVLPHDTVEITRDVQPDGKILILANRKYAGQDSMSLYRYNANNQLDNTFGNNGIVIAVLDEPLKPESMEILPDGKILINAIMQGQRIQVQFFPDGILDYTFGENGFLIFHNEKLP